jgi:hypothetical protein
MDKKEKPHRQKKELREVRETKKDVGCVSERFGVLYLKVFLTALLRGTKRIKTRPLKSIAASYQLN